MTPTTAAHRLGPDGERGPLPVRAEILAGVRMLSHGALGPGMHDIDQADRERVAATWLNYSNRWGTS